jgi:hypothetical protein
MKPLEIATGDHPFELDGELDDHHGINQCRYYRVGAIVVAIGQINPGNQWDDEAFDIACEHLLTSWEGQQKYPHSDAAVQIAEEAYRAGYEAALHTIPSDGDWYAAWSAFEPSEDCKDLVR